MLSPLVNMTFWKQKKKHTHKNNAVLTINNKSQTINGQKGYRKKVISRCERQKNRVLQMFFSHVYLPCFSFSV